MKNNQTKQRIKQLEDNFKEAYILALETQANALKGDLEGCTDEELIEVRKYRQKISLSLCDKATEYMFLKDTDSKPEHFNKYIKLTESFMNKLEAELACRAYF